MLTFLVNIALSGAIGASVAWAGQAIVAQYRWYKLPPLWALLAMMFLLFLPTGGFVLAHYPDWSLMYLAEPEALPFPPMALGLSYPLIAVIAFAVSVRLILTGRRRIVLLILGVCLLAVGLVVLLARTPLDVLGTTVEYREDPSHLRPLIHSPLWYSLVAANLAVLIAWGTTLWRLWLLGRTALKGVIEVEPTRVREEQVPPVSGKRRARST